MSKMGDLLIEIDEMHSRGYGAQEIANATGMPLNWIIEYLEEFDDSEYDGSMDGDNASALASAGFGTDEDYGCASDDLF